MGSALPSDMDGRIADVVVGYARVSTATQAETGLGLPVQRDQIRAYCERERLTLASIYEDPALSGSDHNRPGLLRLLEDARAGRFSRVIVAKLDRIARDTFLTLWVEKELKKAGCTLYSIAEPGRWDDPAQRIFLQLISSFAEFEKSRIVERLRAGRMKKALTGGWPGGKAPFGFSVREKKLIINEREAAIVRRAFRLKMGRHSLRVIAAKLNAEGHRSRNGKPFHPSTVRYLLKNPAYKSALRFAGETRPAKHERLV